MKPRFALNKVNENEAIKPQNSLRRSKTYKTLKKLSENDRASAPMEMNNYNSNKNDASLFREMERLNNNDYNYLNRVNDSTFGESTGFNSPAYINNGYSHPSLPRAPPSYYFQSNPKIIKENQM